MGGGGSKGFNPESDNRTGDRYGDGGGIGPSPYVNPFEQGAPTLSPSQASMPEGLAESYQDLNVNLAVTPLAVGAVVATYGAAKPLIDTLSDSTSPVSDIVTPITTAKSIIDNPLGAAGDALGINIPREFFDVRDALSGLSGVIGGAKPVSGLAPVNNVNQADQIYTVDTKNLTYAMIAGAAVILFFVVKGKK